MLSAEMLPPVLYLLDLSGLNWFCYFFVHRRLKKKERAKGIHISSTMLQQSLYGNPSLWEDAGFKKSEDFTTMEVILKNNPKISSFKLDKNFSDRKPHTTADSSKSLTFSDRWWGKEGWVNFPPDLIPCCFCHSHVCYPGRFLLLSSLSHPHHPWQMRTVPVSAGVGASGFLASFVI